MKKTLRGDMNSVKAKSTFERWTRRDENGTRQGNILHSHHGRAKEQFGETADQGRRETVEWASCWGLGQGLVLQPLHDLLDGLIHAASRRV